VEPALKLLRGVAPKPAFFVNGNNEWSAVYRHRYWIMQRLGGVGVAILDNSAVPLPRNGSHLWIAGVDDPSSRKDRLDRALSGVADSAPIILLAHSPEIFPRAAQAGVDLILVGHTHGGQIRIPFAGAVWVPDIGLFPRWDYGEFREEKSTMIVNGGLGESIIPVRFAIPPEIVLVTLTTMK
jgi:predicted MPP superfamily phosphohydrolase